MAEQTSIKICGIDPGSVGVGICMIENGKYVGSSQIDVKHLPKFYDRLKIVREQIQIHLMNYGPADYYAIEMPWVGFNPNVAIKLGQVRGMIIGEIFSICPNAEISDITPMQLRTFLGVQGKCKKEVMQEKINDIFQGQLTGVIKLGKNQDEIDSIGIAIAAHNKLMIRATGIRTT